VPSVVALKEFDIQMDWTHASLATNLQPFYVFGSKTRAKYLKAKEEEL
jgi:hypothetical protein